MNDTSGTYPNIAILGLGSVGSNILESLAQQTDIVAIEKNPSIVQFYQKKYKNIEEINIIEADATSYFSLKAIKPKFIYHIIISVQDDESTYEIAKILHQRFNLSKSIIALINSQSFVKKLNPMGIHTIHSSNLVSKFIINQMLIGESRALYIGQGVGEILQIQLTKSSPLINKKLKNLPPRKWLIGAIYRSNKQLSTSKENSNTTFLTTEKAQIKPTDKFIIPTGDTTLLADDKIILIGDHKILNATAQYLKAGNPIFPKRYGEDAVILLFKENKNQKWVKHIKWLLNHMLDVNQNFLCEKKETLKLIQSVDLKFSKKVKKITDLQTFILNKTKSKMIATMLHMLSQKNIGIIISYKTTHFLGHIGQKYYLNPKLIKISRKYAIPIMQVQENISKFKEIILYADPSSSLSVIELAIDVSAKFKLPMKVVQVNQPSLLKGNLQQKQALNVLLAVRDLSTLYGIEIQEVLKQGNPVSEVLNELESDSLLVLAISKKSKDGFLIPNTSKILLNKYKGSILFLAV